MSIRVLTGDCREVLATLPEQSVQTCVTSPPYWGLRDYGTATWEGGDAACDHIADPTATKRFGNEAFNENRPSRTDTKTAGYYASVCPKCSATRVDSQLGLERTPEEYVAKMVEVFRAVRRVLRDDGVLFLNLGDSYMSQGGERTYGSYDGTTGRAEQPSRRRRAQRADACDTSDKAPEGYLDRDCLCGSLCDACRAAYRIGKSHSGNRHAPMPVASPSAPIHARTVSERGHLPTSGSVPQDCRTVTAILDSERTADHEHAPPLAVLESMPRESSPQSDDSRSQVSIPDAECQLCGCSFVRCAPASADTTACTCDTGSPWDASDHRTSGKSSLGSAYPNIATTSLKPKDLVGIPWRVAFALQADGWYLRSDIIWHKPNPMPESVTDRPTKAHEYLFLFSKSGDSTYWTHPTLGGTRSRPKPDYRWFDAIAPGVAHTAPPTDWRTAKLADGKRRWSRVNLWDAHDYYYDADAVREPLSPLSIEVHGRYKAGGLALSAKRIQTGRETAENTGLRNGKDRDLTSGRNRRSVWTVATQPYSGAHFATFPPKLIEPCILAGSAPQACEHCGAAWVRVVEKPDFTEQPKRATCKGAEFRNGDRTSAGQAWQDWRNANPDKHLGFAPSCDCENNQGTARSVVLDPFGGAGTTGLVADRLGRDAILIELNPEYANMSRERTTDDCPLFVEVRD